MTDSESIDELRATLKGAHTLMENVAAVERRIGPLGSHARGYTHKLTAALKHLARLENSLELLCSTARQYEELRACIDGGSEAMTHEDAIRELNMLNDMYSTHPGDVT